MDYHYKYFQDISKRRNNKYCKTRLYITAKTYGNVSVSYKLINGIDKEIKR